MFASIIFDDAYFCVQRKRTESELSWKGETRKRRQWHSAIVAGIRCTDKAAHAAFPSSRDDPTFRFSARTLIRYIRLCATMNNFDLIFFFYVHNPLFIVIANEHSIAQNLKHGMKKIKLEKLVKYKNIFN